MAASTVQVSKLGAAVVLYPGDTAVTVSKIGAAVVLGYPESACSVTKLAAYVVLAPIPTAGGTTPFRRGNIVAGG